MPNRQNADFVARNHESIQGDVSGVSVGDNQFTDFAFDSPPYQGVRGEVLHCGLDRGDGAPRCIRIFVTQELKSAFDMI